MNKGMKIFTLVLLTLCLSGLLFAGDNNSAAAYSRVGTGAKAMAMGGTGVAYIDNISATYWNPAGLARLKTFEFGSMVTDVQSFGTKQNFAAIGFRLPNGYAAVSWNNANVDGFDGFDGNGDPTGTFGNSENNIGLSYAYDSPKIKVGVTAKAFISSIDDDSETGFGSDIGIIYDLNQYLSFGAMFRDLYSKYVGDTVPIQITVGAAIHPVYGVTLTSDIKKEQHDEDIIYCAGAEYWIGIGEDVEVNSTLSGIVTEEKSSWDNVLSDAQGGVRIGVNDGSLTAGFGLRYKIIEANYAYGAKKDDELESRDSHRFSIIFRF